MSSMIGCRERHVVHYKEICKKHLCLNCVQMLWRWHLTINNMGNLQRICYHVFFVDVTLPVDTSPDIIHSTTGTKNSPTKQALHLTFWALCWSYNAQELFCRYILPGKFGVQVSDDIYHPGDHFQLFTVAWQFGMSENESRLTRNWHIRAGIEPNLTTG